MLALRDKYYFKTRFALLWSSLLCEPFAVLYAMLPFILCKDFGASAFQIALLTMLRPVVSVFSFYWSSDLKAKSGKLRSNVVFAGIFARLPFLFFPVVGSSWYLIFAGLIYILFTRASLPAWMEILKLNLPKNDREKLFSLGWTLGFVEGICIALGIGYMLDASSESWKVLFFFSSLLGMASVLLQAKMPIKGEESFVREVEPFFTKERIVGPWKETIHLLKTRKDFAHFQWGFMAGGFGIMLIQPALPHFYIDVLSLSYTNLEIAITICKGLGIVLTASIWARMLAKRSCIRLASSVCVLFALFPMALMLAPWTKMWIFVAYLLYGVAQGGSHLIWHLSGPIFAPDEDSSRFTAVNILLVGVRGLVAPPLGGLIARYAGPQAALLLGALFCMGGAYYMGVKRSPELYRQESAQ